MILGNWDVDVFCGHDRNYFVDRNITLDCRGSINIHPETIFGFNIQIYTQSHDKKDFSKVVSRPVIIEKGCFIGSGSILFNCTIGEGSIVSVGSVVASIDIPPFSMVDGNPAKVVAYLKNGQWKNISRRCKCLNSQ